MVEEKNVKPRTKRQLHKQPTKFGKLERIVIIILVVVTVGISAYLGAKARGWIPKPNFSSTVVLGSKTNNHDDPQTALKEKVKNLQGNYGIYVVDVKTGKSYGVGQDNKFEGASL